MRVRARLAWLALALGGACGGETVSGANRPPVLDVEPVVQGKEGEPLGVTVRASDPDDDPVILAAQALPAGASFDDKTGTLLWTPGFDAGRPGAYLVTITGDDGRNQVQASVAITVVDVNRAPTLVAPDTASVNEGVALSLVISADDADGDAVSVTAPDAPLGATFDGRNFLWTPTFEQGKPGAYTVSLVARDNHAPAFATTVHVVAVTVHDVNRRPFFTSAPISGTYHEGQQLGLSIVAEDSDAAQAVTLGMQKLTGTTATLQTDGTFTWSIPAGLEGTFQYVLQATDDGDPPLTAERTETLVVELTNLPPALTAPNQVSASEGLPLAFTLTGKPADRTGPAADAESTQALAYSMVGVGGLVLPASARLDAFAGAFTWNVECGALGTYQVQFTVTDNGTPARSASHTTIINVADRNCPPAFTQVTREEDASSQAARPTAVPFTVAEKSAITLRMWAVDPDGDPITFALDPSTQPAGSTFVPATQIFTWTPSCSAATGSPYTLAFTAQDAGAAPVTQQVRITVSNVNCAPQLTRVCGKPVTAGATSVICNAAEGSLLTFTTQASDEDSDPVTFDANLTGKLASATLDPATGAFRWLPACQDSAGSPYLVTFTAEDPGGQLDTIDVSFEVAAASCRPQFDQVLVVQNAVLLQNLSVAEADSEKSVTVDEAANVSIGLHALSPRALPLTFTTTQLMDGASLTPDTAQNSAAISWRTGCAQKGDDRVVAVVSDDNGADALALKVHVNERNCLPALGPVPTVSVAEGATAIVDLLDFASDPDGDQLTDFTLAWVGTPLAGASLGRTTGLFTLAPGFAAAGSYQANVTVSDRATAPPGAANATTSVFIEVSETNRPPALSFSPQGSGPGFDTYAASEGQPIAFSVVATDPDESVTDFTFTWTDGAGNPIPLPEGASLVRTTGAFAFATNPRSAGDYQITFLGNDRHAPTASVSSKMAYVHVSNVDRAPTVSADAASVTIGEGSALLVEVTGQDADSDVVALAAAWKTGACPGSGGASSTLPAGASFASAGGPGQALGLLTWTPDYTQAASYCFIFTATAASVNASASTTVNVLDVDPCGDTTCPWGQTCRMGDCVTVYCSIPGQCAAGEICNGGGFCAVGHTAVGLALRAAAAFAGAPPTGHFAFGGIAIGSIGESSDGPTGHRIESGISEAQR